MLRVVTERPECRMTHKAESTGGPLGEGVYEVEAIVGRRINNVRALRALLVR